MSSESLPAAGKTEPAATGDAEMAMIQRSTINMVAYGGLLCSKSGAAPAAPDTFGQSPSSRQRCTPTTCGAHGVTGIWLHGCGWLGLEPGQLTGNSDAAGTSVQGHALHFMRFTKSTLP
jgi:hypothetical protein